MLGFRDVEADVVFEQTELFEPLGEFERSGGERGEALQRGTAIGIEAEVLEIHGGGVRVAVEGYRSARKVKCASVGRGDHFDRVRIADLRGLTADFEGRHVHIRLRERREQRGDVCWFEHGLVALDVDVDFGRDLLRDGK